MIVHFDLINNAQDSLRLVIHALTWPDAIPSDRQKHAILSAYHCTELLLKEKLRQINPAFLWDNIDKYPSLNSRTVNLEKAISRLKNIGSVRFNKKEIKALKRCRNMRNAIQHFEFDLTEAETRIILAKVLSFIFSFGKSELNIDLEAEYKNDDTWNLLLENLYEFTEEYGPKIYRMLMELDRPVAYCSNCNQETVDLIWGKCNLCGRNYEED